MGIQVKLFTCNLLLSKSCLTGILMLAATILMSESAVASEVAADSIMRFSEKIYFRKSSAEIDTAFADNASALERIDRFTAGADSLSDLHIEILGSASPEGSLNFNRNLARRRANSLLSRLGASRSQTDSTDAIVSPADSVRSSWPALRFASLTASWTQPLAPQVADSNQFGGVSTARTDSLEELPLTPLLPATPITPAAELQSQIDSPKSGGGCSVRFFLSTNMLYDAALTPNIGAGICFADRFTVYADWMHAWWSNRPDRFYWRVYGGDIELRWQFGRGRSLNPLSGHRIGIYASMVTYDFQFGRSHTGVMGDKFNYAAGVSYGYSLPLTRRLSLDFSLGVGYMWGRYMKQHLIDTHDVWQSTHSRRWFGPTRAEVSLVWLIGRDNVNTPRAKKGGSR